jgi:hypothetical protein
VHITAEYLSEDEPLQLLLFHYVKSSRNRISAPGEGRPMRIPTLNEIKSQTDQADGNRLIKPCKKIGQKSDKAKCKSLKRELLSCEGKVLQNLNSPVRFRPAPPTLSGMSVTVLKAKVFRDPSGTPKRSGKWHKQLRTGESMLGKRELFSQEQGRYHPCRSAAAQTPHPCSALSNFQSRMSLNSSFDSNAG